MKEGIQNNLYDDNKYFSPPLFKIIHKELHSIPSWSGIMVQYKNIGKRTRLSNNYVENWFGQLKNNILKNNIVSISQISIHLNQFKKFIF